VDLIAGWLRGGRALPVLPVIAGAVPPLPDVMPAGAAGSAGAVDTLEMLCGSALYVDLLDDPEFVAHALDTVAAGQVALAQQLASFLNDGPPGSPTSTVS